MNFKSLQFNKSFAYSIHIRFHDSFYYVQPCVVMMDGLGKIYLHIICIFLIIIIAYFMLIYTSSWGDVTASIFTIHLLHFTSLHFTSEKLWVSVSDL